MKIATNIIFCAMVVVIVAAATFALTGCAETGPHTSATDWRSIHQPAPTTPGGGDGHGN